MDTDDSATSANGAAEPARGATAEVLETFTVSGYRPSLPAFAIMGFWGGIGSLVGAVAVVVFVVTGFDALLGGVLPILPLLGMSAAVVMVTRRIRAKESAGAANLRIDGERVEVSLVEEPQRHVYPLAGGRFVAGIERVDGFTRRLGVTRLVVVRVDEQQRRSSPFDVTRLPTAATDRALARLGATPAAAFPDAAGSPTSTFRFPRGRSTTWLVVRWLIILAVVVTLNVTNLAAAADVDALAVVYTAVFLSGFDAAVVFALLADVRLHGIGASSITVDATAITVDGRAHAFDGLEAVRVTPPADVGRMRIELEHRDGRTTRIPLGRARAAQHEPLVRALVAARTDRPYLVRWVAA